MSRVLVVDDEPDVLLLCRLNLQQRGHELLEATDGSTALELAVERHPDVVVLDLMMPGMNGYEVLETLQNDEQNLGHPGPGAHGEVPPRGSRTLPHARRLGVPHEAVPAERALRHGGVAGSHRGRPRLIDRSGGAGLILTQHDDHVRRFVHDVSQRPPARVRRGRRRGRCPRAAWRPLVLSRLPSRRKYTIESTTGLVGASAGSPARR